MKKNIFTLIVLLFTLTISAQEINWITLEEAIELQKTAPRKIMLDAYTVWCGPCKMLDKNTFQNADVVEYVNKNYYAVKFNAEGNSTINYKNLVFSNPNYKEEKASRRNSSHQFSKHMSINAYPTIVFMDENADLITTQKGYRTPQQLELLLKLFKNDKHKEMKEQGDYQKFIENFKYEFTN